MAGVEFEDRLARLEMMALEQASLLELRQYAIDRGETDVHAVVDQKPVYIFRRHVTHFGLLEKFKNLQSREGGLEADALQVVRVAHGLVLGCLSGVMRRHAAGFRL